jgi:hypothetical protein
MSWRIENTNPFALLSELPDGWAQTCFLRPPRDLPTPCLLAMLDLVRRVLRDDGALWLSLPGRGSQPQVLQLVENAGWLRHARGPNGSRASLILRRSPVMLFSTDARRGASFAGGCLPCTAISPGLRSPIAATRLVRARCQRGGDLAALHRLVCSQQHTTSGLRCLRRTLAVLARVDGSWRPVAVRLLTQQRPRALSSP